MPATEGHEQADVDVRAVVGTGVALALVTAVVLAVTALQLHFFTAHPGAAPASQVSVGRPAEPPEPRLQTAPLDDLRALRAREDALLTSYGWVDRAGGVVRIPIDRAKELVAEGR